MATAKSEVAWLTGHADVPQSFRVAPFLGMPLLDRDRLRGHARSRLARWSCIRLQRRELVSALAYEMAIMLRSGYPPALAARAWSEHSQDYKQSEIVRLMCRRSEHRLS